MAEWQFMNGAGTEVQDKQALAYLLPRSGTIGVAASGVIEGLGVTQTATASGSVLVGAGACDNQGSLGQGADLLVNGAQKTLDVFTANPMGGVPRNDIVVFDSVTSSVITVVGTPNAAPSDPTIAATRTPLARLRHTASATTIPTANIDDLREILAPRGTVAVSVTGARVTGVYDPDKPILRHYKRISTATSDNGNVSIPLVNTGVMFASMTVESTATGVGYPVLNNTFADSTQVVWRIFDVTAAGAAMLNRNCTVQAVIDYQV